MMTDSKHTPGPWRANASWIEGPAMALRIASVDWPSSTPGSAPRNSEEARANAKLIATAPELLDASRRAIAMIELMMAGAYQVGLEGSREWDELSVGADIRGTADVLRAAIAKAEGK